MIIVKASTTIIKEALQHLGINTPEPKHFMEGIIELQNQFMRHGSRPAEPACSEEFEYIILKLPIPKA